jgi:hypothetical protein
MPSPKLSTLPILSLSLSLFPSLIHASPSCETDTFTPPQIPGTKILNLHTTTTRNYAPWPDAPGFITTHERPVDCCNVTLTYTHPGWNDSVNVYVWLPLDSSAWNGRFLGAGGGGWAAGFEGGLAAGVGLGYAAAMTDAGHATVGKGPESMGWDDWLLHEPGVVNLAALYDFAYVALDDMTKMAKQVVQSFYGREAAYSYWSGCSTGGRQAMVQAQRFPDNYDGLLSVAPAMNWASFVVSELWPQVIMNELGVYPPRCEFDAITAAAIEACDELDGVKDGVVSAHGQCTFDASTVVGRKIACNGSVSKNHTISQEAARVASETWRGPTNAAGASLWPGLPRGTSFYIPEFGPFGGLVQTECPPSSPTDGTQCSGKPFVMVDSYLRKLVAKDPDFDTRSVTRQDFYALLHQSRQEQLSVMDTANPDLSGFKAAGGKMIHWHGIADQLIAVNGSTDYYSRVQALDPEVRDFYRYFEVPGVTHCSGGSGPLPESALESLVEWVEKGKAPGSIEGVAGAVKRPICAWPLVAVYKGGDVEAAESFECKEDFTAFGFPKVVRASGTAEGARSEL